MSFFALVFVWFCSLAALGFSLLLVFAAWFTRERPAPVRKSAAAVRAPASDQAIAAEPAAGASS